MTMLFLVVAGIVIGVVSSAVRYTAEKHTNWSQRKISFFMVYPIILICSALFVYLKRIGVL